MDILSYILSKKNNGSNTGGSGGTGGSGSSNASVVVKGGAVVDPTQIYSRVYFNTKLSNEEVMALIDTLELNYQGVMEVLYRTNQDDMIIVIKMVDYGLYLLGSISSGALFAINGNLVDESITFTGWNPNIDFSNGIEIIGNTTITEIPADDGPIPIGANNDKIVDLFSSEPIKKSINKGLSGVYDGNNIEVGSTHIDVSSLLDENKLPLNIDVVDNNLAPGNIIKDTTILGVTGTYPGIIPGGTINITSTNVVDVTNYAHAKVVDKNLVAGNIARNKTILGITGTYVGDASMEDDLITRAVTSYSNDRVTSIGSGAFYKYSKLTNIDFPLVANVGEYAFSECNGLTDISLPKVTSIGAYAFSNCTNLTNVDFPLVTSIGINAFMECPKLTSVTFPKITYLGENALAFSNCTTVNLPNVTSTGSRVFYKCTKLTDANLPKLAYIGKEAFYNCTNLTSVDFPLVVEIKDRGFENCTNLTSINFPRVKKVFSGAFEHCYSLISVDLPLVDFDAYGDSAFAYCNSLVSVNIPQSTYVTRGMFYGCTSLISVNISNAAYINNDPFYNCRSLIKLFISRTDKLCALRYTGTFYNCCHILGTTDATYNPEGLKDGYIYVPASLLSQYKVATNWSVFASQIIGHEDLEAGATLPNYTTDTFTTQTWYSDERLTTVVTEVATAGKYYCRLEA